MTKPSGGATLNRGPAAKPASNQGEAVVGNAREQGEDSSLDDHGETSPADECTAHDRAS